MVTTTEYFLSFSRVGLFFISWIFLSLQLAGQTIFVYTSVYFLFCCSIVYDLGAYLNVKVTSLLSRTRDLCIDLSVSALLIV